MRFKLTENDITITLEAVGHGRDLNISIYGGERPHIGAVAVSQARPSLADPEKISASTSVITICGHKEDLLARKVAERVAAEINGVVSVACGIHVDGANREQILGINETVLKLLDLLIANIEG